MTASGKNWTAFHADTVDVSKSMPDNSVDFSVFSLPFSSLYVYSNSPRDMGNVRDDDEFFKHYDYLVEQTLRVMKPGRLVAIHCMNLPTSKERDGIIGVRDFRGDIIRAYQKRGFIYHSEICIWKDPVTAVARTHALGLLYKQLRKDSCMSRQGIADYVVVMRKPGVNPDPVTHTHESFPVERWQRYASPVWMDIDQSDTLQYRSAREDDDERHLCPLQLPVIRRCIELWSNPNDVVWSPFMGIGSEGVVALEMGRRFIGAELKESYFKQAVANLTDAENHQQLTLESMFEAPT
jgi:DNA modification methylase